jgi:hypothetical protein
MDLGGVDVEGTRGEPHEGDELYGLYQHKRSFGGEWLELTGAHERADDPEATRWGDCSSAPVGCSADERANDRGAPGRRGARRAATGSTR